MNKTKRNLRRRTGPKAHSRKGPSGVGFAEAAACLAEIGKGFYARGWVLGTSGNFSAVISREPLRLAITSPGLAKGTLTPKQFLEMDEAPNFSLPDCLPS